MFSTINKISKFLNGFGADRKGATAIEYALIGSGVALMIMASVFSLGGTLSDTYDEAATAIASSSDDGGSSNNGNTKDKSNNKDKTKNSNNGRNKNI